MLLINLPFLIDATDIVLKSYLSDRVNLLYVKWAAYAFPTSCAHVCAGRVPVSCVDPGEGISVSKAHPLLFRQTINPVSDRLLYTGA